MLTSLTLSDVPGLLSDFFSFLEDDTLEKRVFAKIMATLRWVQNSSLGLSQCVHQQKEAVDLAKKIGMHVCDQSPTQGFTWDGFRLSIRMEPSVIIHDVAHFQVCTPDRRNLPDFGLGAGPETGNRTQADTHAQLHGICCDIEESLASLLGILWEVELGHPAILAFLEQNWLEGGCTITNCNHLRKTLLSLHLMGLIDDKGCPQPTLRTIDDLTFWAERSQFNTLQQQ